MVKKGDFFMQNCTFCYWGETQKNTRSEINRSVPKLSGYIGGNLDFPQYMISGFDRDDYGIYDQSKESMVEITNIEELLRLIDKSINCYQYEENFNMLFYRMALKWGIANLKS